VKFWDTSALVPLVVDEPATAAMRKLAAGDHDVVVWLFTGVELLSTLGRLGRASAGLEDVLPRVRGDVVDLCARCITVTHVTEVKRRAERLVGVHPLAAADALQLAAALVAAGDRPETMAFVTLDRVLARAARLEGFPVLGDTERGVL
jgi:predicted nucleic acid-binding protein